MIQDRHQANPHEITEYHEAGHGVLSHHLGFTPQVITIAARKYSLGHMTDDPTFAADYENDRMKGGREIYEDGAVVCYAGLAAEAHLGFGLYV